MMPLSRQLERALYEALRVKDENDWFNVSNCFAEDGSPVKRQFFYDLEDKKYIKNMVDGGTYQLESKAFTYDEDKAEYERQLSARSSNIVTFNAPTKNLQLQQGTHNSIQNMAFGQSSEVEELFKSMLQILEENSFENHQAIKAAILEMKEAAGKPSFKERYDAFIQSAANHMEVFLPFMPQLTALLATVTLM